MGDFVGFVGPAYSAPSIYQDVQELINWYIEVDPAKKAGERGFTALYPTEGLTLQLSLGTSAEVRGMYVPAGGSTLYVVSGNTLFSVSSGFVATAIGTLSSYSTPVSMVDNRICLYLVDGANRYTYTYATSTFANVGAGDGAFNGANKVDYVDDFFVYNDPQSNQWGCSSPLSGVSPVLSFSSKDSSPDNIVSLICDHRQVLLIGEYTTEQWINVGSFPFPFQRIPGVSMQHGCAAQNSVTLFGESTAWLAQDISGAPVVIHMNGYQPQRISTHAVENDITGGVISDAIGFRYRYNGHEFYILTFPTQDKTWVFDLATQEWHKRAWVDTSNTLHRIRANCFCYFQGLNLVGDWQNGIIYSLDPENYTDNGNPILRLRRAPHITNDLNRVTHNSLQIQFQPGVGLSTGQGSNPKCMMRWSDDGGSTYSNSYFVNIGAIGQYKNRAIKKQLGMARDRVYEVSITDPVYAAIVSAEIMLTPSDD